MIPPIKIVTGKIILVIGNNIKYNLRALISATGRDLKKIGRVSEPAARKSAALSLTPEVDRIGGRRQNSVLNWD